MNTSFHARRAIEGDEQSLEWLANRFLPLVQAQVRLRLGGRGTAQDVEDVVQDVWVVAVRRISDLKSRGGRLAPVLVSFLGKTVIHTCNNLLRKRIREQWRGGPAGGTATPGMSELERMTRGIVTRVMHAESADRVRRCLELMSEDKRDVLALRLLEGLTNQQIASLLGLAPNTVAVRYKRALEELRDHMPRSDFRDLPRRRDRPAGRIQPQERPGPDAGGSSG